MLEKEVIRNEIQNAVNKELRIVNGMKKEVTHYLGKPRLINKNRKPKIHIVDKRTDKAVCNPKIQITNKVKNFLMDDSDMCKSCYELFNILNGRLEE